MCSYISLEESIYKRESGGREVEELGNGESYLDFKTSQVMPLKKSSSNKRDLMGQYVLPRNLNHSLHALLLLYCCIGYQVFHIHKSTGANSRKSTMKLILGKYLLDRVINHMPAS